MPSAGLIIILLMFQLSGIGCRGSFERPDEARPTETGDGAGSTYDPIGMPEDAEIVPEKYPIPAKADTPAARDTVAAMSAESGDSLIGLFETYRIQLFTSSTYGPAARELEIADEVFDQKVHLDYEVPYYKIRVGDFADREEAETYLPAAMEAGYKNAWIVKVTINVKNIEETYDEDIPPLIDSLEVYPDDTGSIYE